MSDFVGEIDGLRLVEREIALLADACEDTTPVMRTIGAIGERRAMQAIKDKQAPEIVADYGDADLYAGDPWPGPEANTEAARRGEGSSMELLRDTGRGAQSISSVAGDGWVEIGAGVDYMAYQHGGTRGPYTIRPREPGGKLAFMTAGGLVVTDEVQHPGLEPRPFVGFDVSDVDRMLELMYRHLLRAGA